MIGRNLLGARVRAGAGVSLVLTALMSILVASGCDDKKGPALAPSASSLASATPPKDAKTTRLTIDPASSVTMTLDAPKEKIKAQASGASGSLDIDFSNLTSSRGEVKFDLTTIATKTFDDDKQNATQTTHARTWLEVADGEQGKLEDGVKAANRYAVYVIRSIENPLPDADVNKIPSKKDGADDVRAVTLTTKGELLIHGHKVDRDADVDLELRYAPGATIDKPKSITVKTKRPFKVQLAEHDVKPRDGFGKIAKGSFHLLGTKVAETAEVTLDLRAKPQS